MGSPLGLRELAKQIVMLRHARTPQNPEVPHNHDKKSVLLHIGFHGKKMLYFSTYSHLIQAAALSYRMNSHPNPAQNFLKNFSPKTLRNKIVNPYICDHKASKD